VAAEILAAQVLAAIVAALLLEILLAIAAAIAASALALAAFRAHRLAALRRRVRRVRLTLERAVVVIFMRDGVFTAIAAERLIKLLRLLATFVKRLTVTAAPASTAAPATAAAPAASAFTRLAFAVLRRIVLMHRLAGSVFVHVLAAHRRLASAFALRLELGG
jgi:hypothetical protein